MTVFVVLTPTERADVALAITGAFPDNFLKIADGQWLVSAPGITTQNVTEKLGAAKGEKGSILVASIGSAWGWHSSNIWEWIRAKTVA